MPLAADQYFLIADAFDPVQSKVTVGTGIMTVPPAGVGIKIGSGATAAELFAIESVRGFFTQLRDYVMSEVLKDVASPNIVVSCNSDGAIVEDGTRLYLLEIGAEGLATNDRSHHIDAGFEVVLNRLLEESVDG